MRISDLPVRDKKKVEIIKSGFCWTSIWLKGNFYIKLQKLLQNLNNLQNFKTCLKKASKRDEKLTNKHLIHRTKKFNLRCIRNVSWVEISVLNMKIFVFACFESHSAESGEAFCLDGRNGMKTGREKGEINSRVKNIRKIWKLFSQLCLFTLRNIYLHSCWCLV